MSAAFTMDSVWDYIKKHPGLGRTAIAAGMNRKGRWVATALQRLRDRDAIVSLGTGNKVVVYAIGKRPTDTRHLTQFGGGRKAPEPAQLCGPPLPSIELCWGWWSQSALDTVNEMYPDGIRLDIYPLREDWKYEMISAGILRPEFEPAEA